MEVLFTEKRFVEKCWAHKVEALVTQGQLSDRLELAEVDNEDLRQNWQVVKDWDEESRYKKKTQKDAEEVLAAITDPKAGVLTWLRNLW